MNVGPSTKQMHQLVTGKLVNGRIENPFWAGEAFYHPDHGFFEIIVSLFNDPWYISPNKSNDTFTIFREKVEEEGAIKFRRPIGKAVIADHMKSYLKIRVPLWNPRYAPYLSLFPNR